MLTGLKMKRLSCVLLWAVAGALLSGALVDCCNCSRRGAAASDPASQGRWQGDLSYEQEVELFYACAMDDLTKICEYLDGGGDPNRIGRACGGQGYPGYPLIVSAARYNSARIVQRLIDAGADINKATLPKTDRGRDGRNTALNAAVTNVGLETVQCLLRQADMNRNLRNDYGQTPLEHLVSSDADNGGAGFLGVAIKEQLQTLKSGVVYNDRLIDACCDFVQHRMSTYDLRQLVQYEQDAKTVLSLVQGVMEDSLLPGAKDNFYREVFENGRGVEGLQSMFKPIPDYGTQVLQLLLADKDVDLVDVDNKGNTVLHLAAKMVIRKTRTCCSRHFEQAVKWLQIVRDNERVKLEVSLDATNAAGEPVQQCINEALQCIRERARATARFAEARAEETEFNAARATAQLEEEARATARLIGVVKKVLLVGSAVAVSVLLARRYSAVAGLFGWGWNACGGRAAAEWGRGAWDACGGRLVSRWWRGAWKDQMW
jgi:ankyrin repeat protein